MSLLKETVVCETDEQTECNKEIFTKYRSNDLECLTPDWCPLECYSHEYKPFLSFGKIETTLHSDMIHQREHLLKDFVTKPINSEKLKNSIVKLDIFYDSLSYTISTESPKLDTVSFLANLGGTLGLFLGLSVFSLFELVEVLIELFLIKITK